MVVLYVILQLIASTVQLDIISIQQVVEIIHVCLALLDAVLVKVILTVPLALLATSTHLSVAISVLPYVLRALVVRQIVRHALLVTTYRLLRMESANHVTPYILVVLLASMIP
jgi:hypothetical protein